jgi:hypothetical protein
VDEYGLRAVAREVTEGQTQFGVYAFVTYAAVSQSSCSSPEGWKVTLSLAPLRLELDLLVSNRSGSEYSIEELHALQGQGPFPPRQHGLYEAMHSPEELLAEFSRLASVLRAAGGRFFAGDPTLWSDLAAQRDRRTQDDEDKRAVAQSELAFQAKDWCRVVQLLEPMASRLGKAPSARLAYARKHASSAT